MSISVIYFLARNSSLADLLLVLLVINHFYTLLFFKYGHINNLL